MKITRRFAVECSIGKNNALYTLEDGTKLRGNLRAVKHRNEDPAPHFRSANELVVSLNQAIEASNWPLLRELLANEMLPEDIESIVTDCQQPIPVYAMKVAGHHLYHVNGYADFGGRCQQWVEANQPVGDEWWISTGGLTNHIDLITYNDKTNDFVIYNTDGTVERWVRVE